MKKYPGFKVEKEEFIKEQQCLLTELTHEASGARIVHLGNEDPENVFCLSFRTYPSSSNGVAHILEHTVLCGSKKYPVKDPFFAMNRRSLNTFMNAFTGSDFTCYPASSQVPNDFYNLLEVYLDAVFYPNLKEMSFLQEGWRYDFSEENNPDSPLMYKGIVYNEMKGALSAPTSRLFEAIGETLFPDLTYGVSSGGNPQEIPQLTYEELIDFHRTYYHPSRCIFYLYGNLPLEDHLSFLTEKVLKETKKKEDLPPLPKQPRFSSLKRKVIEYPIPLEESLDEKSFVALSWLTCSILDQEELLALTILESVLMDTDASPLKKAILASGLCKDAGGYIDSEISEIPFILIFQGCNPDAGDLLDEVVKQTLQKLVKEGLNPDRVEDALDQLEFDKSEITGGGYPFGLDLFMRSGLLKQHGGNIEDGLTIHSHFKSIRERIQKNPQLFEQLIETYLLNNPHQTIVTAIPSYEVEARETLEETEALKAKESTMSDADRQELLKRNQDLDAFQKKQEDQDLDVLPKVTLGDVPKEIQSYPLSIHHNKGMTVYHHEAFTNRIVYAGLSFPLPSLRNEELPYLRLLSVLLTEFPAGGMSLDETLELIQGATGGFSSYLSLNTQANNPEELTPRFHLSGKALYRKTEKLFYLLKEFTIHADLSDKRRLRELILKHFSTLESTLNHKAIRYALTLSSKGLSSSSYLNYLWHGLDYFRWIRTLATEFDSHAGSLIEKLGDLQGRVLGLEEADLVITSSEDHFNEIQSKNYYGLGEVIDKPFTPWENNLLLPKSIPQGISIGSGVAFTGKALKTVPFTHAASPYLSIASHLFDHLVLHPLVREQGGAYGSRANNNALSGTFQFYAYRDPNIASTLNAFEIAIQTILTGEFTKEQIESAQLETIQTLDSPIPPGARGKTAYHWMKEGITDQMRQDFRRKVLNAGKEEIIQAVKDHIEPAFHQSASVVFAGKALIEKENEKLKPKGQSLPLSAV